MNIHDAIQDRHSVRSFTDKKIDGDVLEQLKDEVAACNEEGVLHIQLLTDEPKAFDSMLARYGKFSNVKNYFALVGKKTPDLEEKCGYYGERLVLKAQQLGLNTCWVGMSYSRGKAPIQVNSGEKRVIVIALGYGVDSGVSHRVKPLEEICRVSNETMPPWFLQGMEAVQLAPTAMNQQKFLFELNGTKVKASAGSGFYTRVDLGIAKYHFEVGAAGADWLWA